MHHQVAVSTILELNTLFNYLIRKKVLVLKSRGKFSQDGNAGNNNSIKMHSKTSIASVDGGREKSGGWHLKSQLK